MNTIKKPDYARRVHIVPVGFDIDRAYMPLINMEADKVYLFAETTDKAETIEYFIEEITKNLKKQSKPIEIERRGKELSEIELYTTLREYRKIIDEEKDNQIFINVSTGTKIHAIAGMIASMIFKDDNKKIMPYYVVPESYTNRPEEKDQYSVGCKEIKTMPNYRIEKPPEDIIKVLAIIEKLEREGEILTQKIIVKRLEKEKITLTTKENQHKNTKNDVPNAAKYNALQRKYIIPLTAWGYIKVIDKQNRKRIEITKEGKNALMFLRD